MSGLVDFTAPVPGARKRDPRADRWNEVLAELRANPGRWGKVHDGAVAHRTLEAWKAAGVEIRTSREPAGRGTTGKVRYRVTGTWARYVGAAGSRRQQVITAHAAAVQRGSIDPVGDVSMELQMARTHVRRHLAGIPVAS